MPHIMVVAETRRGVLRDVSLELVSAASQLAASAGSARISVAVISHRPSLYVDALNLPAVDCILTIATTCEHFEGHVATQHLRELIQAQAPDVVLVAHSVDSMAFAPAAAALLETGFASDVTALSWSQGLVVHRGSYAGKLIAELDFPGKDTTIVMIRPGSFAPPENAASGRAEVVSFSAQPVEPRTRHCGFRDPEPAGVDITKSPFLLSIGRGIGDEENIPRLEALAERMGATLSVSRPLVDAGWAPSARQVGQSGKTVKPKVYLALGISGAVQHLEGMSKAETIIAVNTDADAPIFNVAHYGAVADLFDVVGELERRYGE